MPPGSYVNSDSDLESVISIQELNHKQRRNSTGPKYFCTFDGCNAALKRLDHLDRHMYHHTGIKKHACTYEGCSKTYSIVTHLKRHIRCIHERTEAEHTKNVPCSIESCDKMFQSASNMQRHIREVHENPKIYHCEHCGEKFTQRLKMRRHEINKHTKEFPYNCSKCKKGFFQEWQYDRHVSKCKTYPCDNCALQFDKWSLYIKHCKETLHGRKYYKCEDCARSFAKPGELQQHITNHHADDSLKVVYRCLHENCTRFYSYERNLKQHQLTAHSGKRFECTCEGCDRVFSSEQNLQKHIQREHKVGKVETKITKTKQRKRRKDAGQSVISNLSKLTGLTVDKNLDKLLRVRDKNALNEVSQVLTEKQDADAEHVEHEKATTNSNTNTKAVKTIELDALIAIALQGD